MVVGELRMPKGLSSAGEKWSEIDLVGFAYAYEQASQTAGVDAVGGDRAIWRAIAEICLRSYDHTAWQPTHRGLIRAERHHHHTQMQTLLVACC